MTEKELIQTTKIEEKGEVFFPPAPVEEDTDSRTDVDIAPVLEVEAVNKGGIPVVEDNSLNPRISYGYTLEIKENDGSPAGIVSEKSLGYPPRE